MNNKMIPSLVVVAVGCWLLSEPRCSRGCKTVAEHLVTDGLESVINGLFA
jgi:hypothetical protein